MTKRWPTSKLAGMKQTLVLCADDFSLNPAINAAILSLLDQQRLSAVSCMTQSPTWPADAKQLAPWKNHIDIGLHFNLTHSFPACYSTSLPALMLQSTLHLVNRTALQQSLRTQLDRFEQALGCAPDFIDGHQHVHLFPVIRDLFISEYQKRYGTLDTKPWVRSLHSLPGDAGQFKARVLQAMGARALHTLLVQHGIPHNNGFAGIYDFNPNENLDARMQQWLESLPDGGLVMCHPALEYKNGDDAIAAARYNEYRFLSSDPFTQTLLQHNLVLSRYTHR
jgi:predicted glycoside hydrolase/deacetylase ChbG (UPF0249 family)